MQEKHAPSFFSQEKSSRRYSDRFVPQRPASDADFELQHAQFMGAFDKPETPYTNALAEAFWGVSYRDAKEKSILDIHNYTPSAPPKPRPQISYTMQSNYSIDTPNLANDFFLNPLCWGKPLVYLGVDGTLFSVNLRSQNILGIAAGCSATSQITGLGYDFNTLVRTGKDGSIRLLDTKTNTESGRANNTEVTYKIESDKSRGFYLWGKNFGGYYDIRTPRVEVILQAADAYMLGCAYNQHNKSLAVSYRDYIKIFDIRNLNKSILDFHGHKNSGCKALAFSDGSGANIVSGGGTHDKKLIIWNAATGAIIAQHNVGEQICNAHWIGPSTLLTTQGFSSNSVVCWSVDGEEIKQQKVDQQHTDRPLYSAQNPNKPTELVTGAPGGEVRFWSAGPTRDVRRVDTSFGSQCFSIR